MLEKELQSAVLEVAKLTGWRRAHFRPAVSPRQRKYATHMSGEVGYPDLTMVRAPRLIFAELKSEDGDYRKGQREWLRELAGCPGVEVYLWKPRHLEAIATILSTAHRVSPPQFTISGPAVLELSGRIWPDE